MPAILFGVLGHDLVEADGIKGTGLRIVKGRAGEPHIGTKMRIGLGATGMVQATHKAKLIAERAKRLGRFAENKFALWRFGSREPMPLFERILRAGQGHTVGM